MEDSFRQFSSKLIFFVFIVILQVGRATLDSAEKAAPKVKALARTALTGKDDVVKLQEDLAELQLQNQLLRKEISQLRLWKQRKNWIDEQGGDYNLQDLKDAARQRGIVVGGTKSQLLMRLIEAGVLRIDPRMKNE
jgi:putative NADH-flavin reductase